MSMNHPTSSVSVILNKIDLEDLDPKLLDSFNQNTSSNFTDDDQLPLDNTNPISLILNDVSELKINKLLNEFQIKPLHWTDEYWRVIIDKYNWFLHKDNYIGCKICYHIKSLIGKKSLLGTMKLYLMDLTYEDLEHKLAYHNASIQHNKSIQLYKSQLKKINNGTEAPIVIPHAAPIVNIVKKSRPINHFCPLCKKGYKLKKALAKHIFSCSNELNPEPLKLPCQCDSIGVNSIRLIDEHNIETHSSNLAFLCRFCSMEFKQLTFLFSHLLLSHDCYWSPYDEMPQMINRSPPQVAQESPKTVIGNRPERKRSIANSLSDNIYIMYGPKDSTNFPKARDMLKRSAYNRKRKLKEKQSANENTAPSDIRIERVLNESNNQQISKLTISQSSILTCEYCGGRYLSQGILMDHMTRYHSAMVVENKTAEEKRDDEFKDKLNKLINSVNTNTNSSNYNYQHNKKLKSKYIRLSSHMRKIRAMQMKKKLITTENTTKISQEMCKKINQNDYKLLIAKKNKVSASMLTCPACRASFESLDQRFEHVSIHHPELEKFSCKICGLIFSNQTNHRRHLEKSHNNLLPKQGKAAPEKTYSCENCHLVFTNQADLSHHLSFSHPEINEKPIDNSEQSILLPNCDIDAFEELFIPEVDELKILINTDSIENLSHCSNCRLDLHNPFELLVHSYTHEDNSELFQSCPNCNKLFFGKHCKIYLKDHYNSEHLKKPLPQCPTCKLTFCSSYVLEKHQLSECQNTIIDDPYFPLMSDEKLAFSCSQCSLIFAGEEARERFDVHMKKCSFELMDNELLDS